MYAQLTEDDEAPLDGVIYVADRHEVARLVARNAASMGLDALRQLTLDEVIRQTRTAAGGWLGGTGNPEEVGAADMSIGDTR